MVSALASYSSEAVPSLSLSASLEVFVLSLALYALSSWSLSKVFEKAGVEGWKAWIPVYNYIIIFKLGDQNPLLLLTALIPIAGSIVAGVFSIMAVHRINVKFGRGGGSTVLYVFFPFIWLLIIGLGPDQWRAPPVYA